MAGILEEEAKIEGVKVGFDVSATVRSHSPGVHRVVTGVVEALEARGVLDVVRLAPENGQSLRAWRQLALPRAASSQGLAGIHSFTSAFPVRGPGRRVQTVHELPWRHGVRENAGLRHRLWAALGPLRAHRVVCPTEHVARDLRRRHLPGADRIRVVAWGVDPRYSEHPPAGQVDEVLLDRYRLSTDPIVLCPGAVRPKKNLAAILHGAAELLRRGEPRVQLVITGEETQQLRRDLGLASRLGLAGWVSTPGVVPEEDLPGLLRLAAVVPVLSHSEGFGLTALEALACGTPVLVPPGCAQAEVAGDVGIGVDPADPSAVAAALLRAIDQREVLRFSLPERARAFTWTACAERIETLWGELA